MSAPLLGAHVSVAGGLARAFPRGEKLGCAAIQIFVKNANRWQAKPLSTEESEAFKAARRRSPIGPVVAHASYLINLASVDPELAARSHDALGDELERCCRLGIDGLVLHPGAHLGHGVEAGVERVATALDAVLDAVPGRTRILLENTAGQGTGLGRELPELAAIRHRVEHAGRLGVCVDTCHAFAAGYPIHEEAGYEAFFAQLRELLGEPDCLHVNDSLRPFASRRDRHAHIGEGELGRDFFARLVNDRRLAAVPMIVETEPGPDDAGHRQDLETLRRLAVG